MENTKILKSFENIEIGTILYNRYFTAIITSIRFISPKNIIFNIKTFINKDCELSKTSKNLMLTGTINDCAIVDSTNLFWYNDFETMQYFENYFINKELNDLNKKLKCANESKKSINRNEDNYE